MGYIYKITNKTDGKIYVGQTIHSLKDRWRHHRSMRGNCRYLKSAFKKYGIDNFVFEMICSCSDEELDKLEIQYMAELNSMVPNGYNLREGGNGGRHHEETKRKISASLKGRTDIVRTNSFSWIGLHHSEESKKKIADALSIKINQYDLDNNFLRSFNKISDAANEFNIDGSSISKCCKHKYKTAGGFIWKYVV